MTEGEVRTVATLIELRDCTPHTVICDARGQVGRIAQRASSALSDGVHWAGWGGFCDASTIIFPVQAWWPKHPALVEAG